MFHALMGRFQLKLFILITYFSTVVPLTSCVFFPIGLSSLKRHFQQVLKGVEVSSVSSQETEETLNPTRPVENVALTTKGLQEENITSEWDDGGKIYNKNK